MIDSNTCLRKFGDPHLQRNLAVWYCPAQLRAANPALPAKIYANRVIHSALSNALWLCHRRKVLHEIKTFDGCFNIRPIRGARAWSLHSWAVAVDFNAKDNPFGVSSEEAQKRGLTPFTEAFIKCWEETGWDAGARWGYADGMHFQIASLE